MDTKDERSERLAAALRDNLRKRKAQGRNASENPADELSAESRKSRD